MKNYYGYYFVSGFQGGGINFANIGSSPVHPLIYGKSAKKAEASDDDARYIYITKIENFIQSQSSS